MKREALRRIASTAVLLCALSRADAASNPATATVHISATVVKGCTVGVTPMAFGAYTPTNGAVASTATLSAACTTGTRFTVTLNGGTTTGGTIGQRLMTNGAGTLQYNIYADAAHTLLLGDGISYGSYEYIGTGIGTAAALTATLYGNLPDSAANQVTGSGSYTDTITVSVAY